MCGRGALRPPPLPPRRPCTRRLGCSRPWTSLLIARSKKPDGFVSTMRPAVEGRTSRKPEVVRGRILDAALQEFMAAGFTGASTNRILATFGGSKPTMFRHFPTKRALFEGVVARIAAGWRGRVRQETLDETDPRGWLTGF